SEAVCRPRPDQPGRSASRGAPAVLGERARLSGNALQPAVSSEIDMAELQGALSALARSGEAGRGFQLLHPAAPDADARGNGGPVPRSQDRSGSSGQAGSPTARSMARVQKDVPA